MTHFDVLVVGAGPAGAMAAYQVAKAGLKVGLLEKEKLPRYKTCGGAVNIRGEKLLDFPIHEVIERTIYRWRISSHLQHPFTKTYPQPIVHMTMRDRLDEYLTQQAAKAGANVLDECKVNDCSLINYAYHLKTSRGDFTASYLVAADGANSIIRKRLAVPAFRRVSVAVEYEIEGSPRALDAWHDMLALDFGHLKGGYSWVFPKGDHFSIGAGGDISAAKALDASTEAILEHYKKELGFGEIRQRTGHKIPILCKGDVVYQERVVFVGDAGGFADPMTGEGISLALWSGKLAANALVAAVQEDNPRLLQCYHDDVHREIIPELQMSKAFLSVLNTSRTFWVWLLLRHSTFWDFLCQVQRGEKTYMDFQQQWGVPAQWFFARLINNTP